MNTQFEQSLSAVVRAVVLSLWAEQRWKELTIYLLGVTDTLTYIISRDRRPDSAEYCGTDWQAFLLMQQLDELIMLRNVAKIYREQETA